MPPLPHRRSRPPPPIAYASPLKPSNRKLARPTKRQRLSASPLQRGQRGSRSTSYGDENDPIVLAGSSSSASGSGSGSGADDVQPLRESELAGARSNRSHHAHAVKGLRKRDTKGKGPELRLKKKKSQLLAVAIDAVSPRKRKREVDDDLDAAGDSAGDDDDFESYDGSESVRSSEALSVNGGGGAEYTEVDPVFMQDGESPPLLFESPKSNSRERATAQMTTTSSTMRRGAS